MFPEILRVLRTSVAYVFHCVLFINFILIVVFVFKGNPLPGSEHPMWIHLSCVITQY